MLVEVIDVESLVETSKGQQGVENGLIGTVVEDYSRFQPIFFNGAVVSICLENHIHGAAFFQGVKHSVGINDADEGGRNLKLQVDRFTVEVSFVCYLNVNVSNAFVGDLEDGMPVVIYKGDIRLDHNQWRDNILCIFIFSNIIAVIYTDKEGHFRHVGCVVGNLELEGMVYGDRLVGCHIGVLVAALGDFNVR